MNSGRKAAAAKMNHESKDVPLFVQIDPGLHERMRIKAFEAKITYRQFVEEAIRLKLDAKKNKKEKKRNP